MTPVLKKFSRLFGQLHTLCQDFVLSATPFHVVRPQTRQVFFPAAFRKDSDCFSSALWTLILWTFSSRSHTPPFRSLQSTATASQPFIVAPFSWLLAPCESFPSFFSVDARHEKDLVPSSTRVAIRTPEESRSTRVHHPAILSPPHKLELCSPSASGCLFRHR